MDGRLHASTGDFGAEPDGARPPLAGPTLCGGKRGASLRWGVTAAVSTGARNVGRPTGQFVSVMWTPRPLVATFYISLCAALAGPRHLL